MIRRGTMDAMIDAVDAIAGRGDTHHRTVQTGPISTIHAVGRACVQRPGRHFVGMGVSGGEEGARHGPSMMVGGTGHS